MIHEEKHHFNKSKLLIRNTLNIGFSTNQLDLCVVHLQQGKTHIIQQHIELCERFNAPVAGGSRIIRAFKRMSYRKESKGPLKRQMVVYYFLL